MAEFGFIDTSEDLIPAGHVLAEQADNTVTGLGQTEQADKESVPVADAQEYVHKFKDGTVSTYALTEAKKCPVAGKMSEEQLMLILKFSALGMHSMMKEEALPKPAPPDQTKVNPKTAQSRTGRPPIEDIRQVPPQQTADYELPGLKTKEEDVQFPKVPALIKLSKKVSFRPAPAVINRPTCSRLDRIEPVSGTDVPTVELEAVRQLTVAKDTETATGSLPSAVRSEDFTLIPDVPEEAALLSGTDSNGSPEDRIRSLEPIRHDSIDIDDAVWPDEAITVELPDEEPGDDGVLQDFALEELRGIDKYLDELIALSAGETQTIDVTLEEPVSDDLQQEIYHDAVTELGLLPPEQPEEQDLSGKAYRRADDAATEEVLPLDDPVEQIINLTDQGTHEAKTGVLQKLLTARTLAGRWDHVLGILSVYCAFMERA